MLGAPTPILRSFDEKRTRDFYAGFLGFELVFEHRFEEWAPLYRSVKGECVLRLFEHYGDGCPGAAIRIPIDDVKACMAVLRAREFGNSRPGEPQLQQLGSSDITIADPASNRLPFYTKDKP